VCRHLGGFLFRKQQLYNQRHQQPLRHLRQRPARLLSNNLLRELRDESGFLF